MTDSYCYPYGCAAGNGIRFGRGVRYLQGYEYIRALLNYMVEEVPFYRAGSLFATNKSRITRVRGFKHVLCREYGFCRYKAALSLAALARYESLVCNRSSELGGVDCPMIIRGQPELGPRMPIVTFGIFRVGGDGYAKNQSIVFGASGLTSGS